jgi:hypothetical protein
MSYPNSTLKLYKLDGIDNKYDNSFYFSSVSAQTSFFDSKTSKYFTQFTHIRKEQKIRVDSYYEVIALYNYMQFYNVPSIGGTYTKFYAFITDVKYVSEKVTEITYEIDVIQTWLIGGSADGIQLLDCYIEREHTVSDNIGEHILDENLNTGDYITLNQHTLVDANDLVLIVATTFDGTNHVSGTTYNKIYSGYQYRAFNIATGADIDNIDTFLSSIMNQGKGESVGFIFMLPRFSVPPFTSTANGAVLESFDLQGVNLQLSLTHSALGSYIPKNKKLYCYPYSFLEITDNNGQNINLKYEYFDSIGLSQDIYFQRQTTANADAKLMLSPMNYKGKSINYDEALIMKGFPICSWINEFFPNWLAQNGFTQSVGAMGSVMSLGVGIATGNPIAIGAGILGVAQSIGGFVESSVQPNKTQGISKGDVNVSADNMFIIANEKTINLKYAKVIDDYFTRYGYKTNRIGVPNLHSRSSFNYIKTHECNIKGDIPQFHTDKIRQVFNSGITFWHGDYIGEFDRSNGVI